MGKGTIALQSQSPFPTFITGQGLITVGFVKPPPPGNPFAGLNLEPETLQIIAASPIPVTVTAALLINRAILTWKKTLGIEQPALQARVLELIGLIHPNGWVLWSQFGVSPANPDNSAALSSLPQNVLILADTEGDHSISNQWILKSNLGVVSDQSIRIVYNLPALTVQNINFGVIGQAEMNVPQAPGPFPFLNNIYLFGLNFHCPNVNSQMYSVMTFNANNVQVLWMNADQYASYMCCVGSNVEIAYCTGTTSGSTVPGHNGGPGIRAFGTTSGTTPAVPTTRAHSFWVHDCNLQSYDGVLQLSPNNHGWGAGVNFVDVMMENCTLNSSDGPFILIGTNVSSVIVVPFNYTIIGATFRNLNGSAFGNLLYALHGNNPNNSWSNMLFQNLNIAGRNVGSLGNASNHAPSVRVFCFGNVTTPITPAIVNMTFDTVNITNMQYLVASIEGDRSATSIQHLTFTNCTFDQPVNNSNSYSFNVQGVVQDLKILNSSIGTGRNGIDLGKTFAASGSIGYTVNPSVGDILTLNGTVCQFVASAPSITQIQVGPNLSTTLNNIMSMIDNVNQTDANVNQFFATVNAITNILTLTATTGGSGGNSLTFSTTTAGTTVGNSTNTPPPGGPGTVMTLANGTDTFVSSPDGGVTPSFTMTGSTINAIRPAGTNTATGIFFENVDHCSITGNNIVKSGALTPTEYFGMVISLPHVATPGAHGTTNCTVTGNTVHGMQSPPNSATPDANGNVFNGNT